MTPADLQRQNAAYILHNGIGTVDDAIRAYLASYNLPHAKEMGTPRRRYQPSACNSTAERTQATRRRAVAGQVDPVILAMLAVISAGFALAYLLVMVEGAR